MTTAVTFKIRSNNSALVGEDARAEVVRLLRETANKIANGSDGATVFDMNGNSVGSFDAVIDEEGEEG